MSQDIAEMRFWESSPEPQGFYPTLDQWSEALAEVRRLERVAEDKTRPRPASVYPQYVNTPNGLAQPLRSGKGHQYLGVTSVVQYSGATSVMGCNSFCAY